MQSKSPFSNFLSDSLSRFSNFLSDSLSSVNDDIDGLTLKKIDEIGTEKLAASYINNANVAVPKVQWDKETSSKECGGPGCSDSFRRFLSGSSVFRFRLPEVLAGG